MSVKLKAIFLHSKKLFSQPSSAPTSTAKWKNSGRQKKKNRDSNAFNNSEYTIKNLFSPLNINFTVHTIMIYFAHRGANKNGYERNL